MDRINHASAEADKFGAGKDGWTNGDPADPGSGTVPQEEWFDGVQEELVGLIEQAGNTPTDADYGQLADVLLAKVSGLYAADAGIALSGLDDQEAALIDVTALTDARKLLFTFGPTSSRVNVYYNGSGYEFVSNATWLQGTGWVSSGSSEGMISILPGFTAIDIYSALSSNAFTKRFTIDGNPDTTPATAIKDTLYPITVTKALGRVASLAAGIGTGPTKSSVGSNAFNIDATATEVTTSGVEVHFDTAFADTLYHVQVTGASASSDHIFNVSATNAAYCTVYGYDLSTGAAIDPSITIMNFFLDAKGPQ